MVTAKVVTPQLLAPVPGASVVFVDGDGTTHTLATDADGTVTARISDDGSVWHEKSDGDPAAGALFDVFEHLDDRDTIVFTELGHPIMPPSVTSMTIVPNAPTPPPHQAVAVNATCGFHDQLGIQTHLAFEDHCHGVADILVTLRDEDGADWSYAFLPAVPIVDGGTITVPSSAWRSSEQVSGTVAPAGAALTFRNDFGSVSAHEVPLVGSRLCADVVTPQGPTVTLSVPLKTNQTIDVSSLLLPVVTNSNDKWSVEGSPDLHNVWLESDYAWDTASGSGVVVHAYSSAAVPGSIPMIDVPYKAARPIDNTIERKARLLKFDQVERQVAFQDIINAADGTSSLGECLPATSFATSGSR